MPFIYHINTKDQHIEINSAKQNIADFFRFKKNLTCPTGIDMEVMKGIKL